MRILFLLSILLVISITPVFAEEYEIIIVKGSAFDSSCAESNSCLNPSSITITQGDSITWIREDDIHMPINSGTPETGPDMKFRVDGTGLENTFDDIGIFPYYISDMPWIQGEVIVDYSNKKLGNYIEFIRIEKMSNSVILEYEGHIDVNNGFFKIYDYTDYEIGYNTISSDDDGYFSGKWGEEDSLLHPWVEGIYRVEFFVEEEGVDKGGGSVTTFVLVDEFTFKLDFLPEGNSTHEIRILDGSMEKKCGNSCVEPSELHIQRGDRVKVIHNDCDGCNHMTVKVHDPTIVSEEFPLNENRRWWDQTTWSYYDKAHPWITGKIIVGVDNSKKMIEPQQILVDKNEEKISSATESLVCPQGQEPINGVCPDKPIVEKPDGLEIASFVDKSKDPQYYIDRYNNEPSYKKWFHENYPEYDSIAQAVWLELTEKIPEWVKNIFGWYAADQVSEDELLNAIKYLINEGILVVE